MVLGRRRRKPPAALQPKVDRDERIIAWAPSTDGAAVVVVTTRGLFLPGRAERLGWHQIHKATWSGSDLTVVPSVWVEDREGYAVMADDAPVVVGLSNPGGVPAAVRDRVTRSVAYTAHHSLPGGGVRVVARRVPGSDGVAWHVRYDPGTDIGDPEMLAATGELVAEVASGEEPA